MIQLSSRDLQIVTILSRLLVILTKRLGFVFGVRIAGYQIIIQRWALAGPPARSVTLSALLQV
jgi:hypothetical protein